MAGASADGRAPCFALCDMTEPPDDFDIESDFSVQIPLTASVRANGIAAYAFYFCSGLTSVGIPEGVAEIGECAFSECSGLSSIALPVGVAAIGNEAFSGCSSLTSITMPEGVAKIGERAFVGCSGLTSIVVPEGVTEISEDVFCGCRGLRSVTIPMGITNIEPSAFYQCNGLNSINLPESVTVIGAVAFEKCTGLTAAVLPKGVTKIEFQTFQGCSWLVVVRIQSQTAVNVHCTAFDSCDQLTLVVAPRTSGLVGSVIGGVTVVEDTENNRRRALDLQFWRVRTHALCSPRRRRWVGAVLRVANRLLGGPLTLPREMWYMILGAVQRCELGPAP